MKRMKFTFAGLGFALTCELFYRLFARFQPQLILVAAVFYLVYLQAIFALSRRTNTVTFVISSGLIGLFALEWGLVGNTPWGNPNASQLGMFIVHAAYPMAARLFADNGQVEMQDRVLRYWAKFCLVVLCGVLIPHPFLRFAWFIYAPIVGYAGLLLVSRPFILGVSK